MDAYLSREGQGGRGAGWGQGGVYRPRHDAKGLAERRGAPAPPLPPARQAAAKPAGAAKPGRQKPERGAAVLCNAAVPEAAAAVEKAGKTRTGAQGNPATAHAAPVVAPSGPGPSG